MEDVPNVFVGLTLGTKSNKEQVSVG